MTSRVIDAWRSQKLNCLSYITICRLFNHPSCLKAGHILSCLRRPPQATLAAKLGSCRTLSMGDSFVNPELLNNRELFSVLRTDSRVGFRAVSYSIETNKSFHHFSSRPLCMLIDNTLPLPSLKIVPRIIRLKLNFITITSYKYEHSVMNQ